jgi:GT2 family glycosyltransferase
MLKLKDKNVKFVCPKTNYYKNITTKKLIDKKFNYTEDVILQDEFCPMFCFLTHRELYNKIGLIKEYDYSGYEDEEFYHRMKKNGYKQAICGKSWIKHIGSGTMNELLKNNKNILENNRTKCEQDVMSLYK